MKLKNSVFTALALACSSSVLLTAEVVLPTHSATEFPTFVIMQRYRIYAEHCSAEVPALKPEFESLVESLAGRIQEISSRLITSGKFDGLRGKAVPAEVIDAFRDILHDTQHNFERREAAYICPKTLQSLAELDDGTLKSGLGDIFTAVQKMLWNLENGSAR